MFSATFTGIASSSPPVSIGAQLIGRVLTVGGITALYPGITPATASQVTVPRDQDHAATSGQASTRGPERERAAHG
jgi:hypothetical protein